MSKTIANIEVDENKFNSTNHTENLNLPQFIASDKPGWLTDFNGAMEVIDEAAGVLQEQITEQSEDLEAVHQQLDRVDDEINNPETGVRQVLHDTQTRVTDLETVVGDEQHGLVKDVHTLQEDMVQTNTMAVKSNAQLGSIINLLCNKYSTAAQYSQGAYVYTENDDGSLNFLRCTATTHGAFNPDKWEDVTEKLISALDNGGGGGGSQYVLPIAGDADDPDAVLGGVIIGEGLTIDPETGILSRTVTPTEGIGPDYYASQVRAGLVRPNTEAGLNVNSSNGVLSIIIDDSTMEFTNDGRLKAKPDTSRFAQGQGISLSNESVPSISVRLAQENSNLGFDGNGGLRAILPSSAYEIVQGDGITITTDAQNNTKTVSMVQASTNTLGGVRPKSDSFAFESYDQEHPELKKMTIQLKDKGGLQKQDGVGLSIKVDGTTVQIDQTTGELKATGGGSHYELPIASASTLGGIKVGQNLSIDPVTGVLNATGGGGTANIAEDAGITIENRQGTDYIGVDYNTNTLEVDQTTNKLNVKDTAKRLAQDYLGDFQGTTTEMIHGLPGIARLDNPSTVGFYIADATTWNKYAGCTFTFNPQGYYDSHFEDAGASGVPLFVANKNDSEYIRVATLIKGVAYRIGRYDKNAWLPSGSHDNSIKALISPNKFDNMENIATLDVPQIMADVQTEVAQGVAVFEASKADIAHIMRSADPNNVTYTGNRFVPIEKILRNESLVSGDLAPDITSHTNIIAFPNEGSLQSPKRHPYLVLFPLSIKFNNIDDDCTPSSWNLVGKNFSGKLCTLIYYVDVEIGLPSHYGASLSRVPVFNKRITVGSQYLNEHNTANTRIPIEEKIGHFWDGTVATDEFGNMYGAVIVYPQGGIFFNIHTELEVVDLTEGTVRRYFDTVYASSSQDVPDNPMSLVGDFYVYDLSKTTYTDSDIYVTQP